MQKPRIIAISGFPSSAYARFASAPMRLNSSIDSGSERRFSNSEMSAPETNALSPAPAITTTRTSGSSRKSCRIVGIASCISMLSAFRRAGLLKIIQPAPPSLRATILSVFSSMQVLPSWSASR